MNTAITYLYADSERGDHIHTVVVAGKLTAEQVLPLLEGGMYLIPYQIGLPNLHGREALTVEDHVWHRLVSVEPTGSSSTVALSAGKLLSRLAEVKWDEEAAASWIGLPSSHLITMIWIRYPYPFREDEAEGIRHALIRLYGRESGIRKLYYEIDMVEKPAPGQDALVHSIILQGGNEVLHRQIAKTVQAIHLAQALARPRIGGPDWCTPPCRFVEVSVGGWPTWAPTFGTRSDASEETDTGQVVFDIVMDMRRLLRARGEVPGDAPPLCDHCSIWMATHIIANRFLACDKPHCQDALEDKAKKP